MTKPWKKDGSSSADERAPVSDGTSPAPATVPRAARPASASKNALLFLAVLFALGPAIFVYELVFPDFPAPVARGDAAALRELFYSGAPAIVLCENRTRVAHNVALDKVGPAIKQAARLVAADIGLGACVRPHKDLREREGGELCEATAGESGHGGAKVRVGVACFR